MGFEDCLFEVFWGLVIFVFGTFLGGFLVIYYSFSWDICGILGLPLKARAF